MADEGSFLDSVDGEVSFFRNLMRARPLGIHRHFHLLTIRNGISNDTGVNLSIDHIRAKLRTCYNMDTLETFEPEGFQPAGVPTSPPIRAVDSPLPTDDLRHHPFFRFEYALPADDWIESEMARRRTRDTPSPPSSRPPSPPPTKRPRGGGRGRGRRGGLAAAGLVAGDSDSSALTDDSPDEDGASVAPTVTGTDGGTEDVDEEEEETEGSPAPSSRRRGKGRRGGSSARGRGKGVKKRKR